MDSHRRSIVFPAPNTVEVIEEPVPEIGKNEVQARTLLSAVSPGTERLLYRGNMPDATESEGTIDSVLDDTSFPISPGYSCVGRIEKIGDSVSDKYRDKLVFSFQPHTSRFVSPIEEVVVLPSKTSARDAALIPNVETAVNLVMDGQPIIGETVVIFGQGVVGILTLALTAQFPVRSLYTVEPDPSRRARSEAWGADRSFDPNTEAEELRETLEISRDAPQELNGPLYEGADLVYELSGAPNTLDEALTVTGFDGRIIVGSWYGSNRSSLNFGGRFHRSRMEITSSQVSTIDPAYRGRWTKARRMQTVLNLLDVLTPSALISTCYSLSEAPTVYEELTSESSGVFQPAFEYE